MKLFAGVASGSWKKLTSILVSNIILVRVRRKGVCWGFIIFIETSSTCLQLVGTHQTISKDERSSLSFECFILVFESINPDLVSR